MCGQVEWSTFKSSSMSRLPRRRSARRSTATTAEEVQALQRLSLRLRMGLGAVGGVLEQLWADGNQNEVEIIESSAMCCSAKRSAPCHHFQASILRAQRLCPIPKRPTLGGNGRSEKVSRTKTKEERGEN